MGAAGVKPAQAASSPATIRFKVDYQWAVTSATPEQQATLQELVEQALGVLAKFMKASAGRPPIQMHATRLPGVPPPAAACGARSASAQVACREELRLPQPALACYPQVKVPTVGNLVARKIGATCAQAAYRSAPSRRAPCSPARPAAVPWRLRGSPRDPPVPTPPSAPAGQTLQPRGRASP